MSAGENPRCVVPSVDAPTPQRRYEALSCTRGHGENASKAVPLDRRSDRTSATTFLAHATRLGRACAAYALHQALRTQPRQHPGLAQAQPSPIILPLVKMAAQVKQYTDRILRHLPSPCPVKALLQRITTSFYVVPTPVGTTS